MALPMVSSAKKGYFWSFETLRRFVIRLAWHFVTFQHVLLCIVSGAVLRCRGSVHVWWLAQHFLRHFAWWHLVNKYLVKSS